MEHRWKERCPVSLDVVVRDSGGLTLQGRTRDISPDGMFIRIGCQSVSRKTVVEIEIPHRGRLRGWVLHAGDEGIGVMFCSISSSTRDLLDQLLAGTARHSESKERS